ncbi:MAG: MlaE family ABC transporter permease [Pyrinomonadaceae bacterium]
MNPFKKFLFELQEISYLIFWSFAGLRKSPRYFNEIIRQMDVIGVGSLSIVALTGFFTGAALVLQSFQILAYYGAQAQLGQMISFSLIRELGPVLSALMVSGRIGSAISAELGSMVVSQQIDAMRALGTDPLRKLVAPRIIALILMLPLLTVVSDVFGIIGGGFVANNLFGLDYNTYLSSVHDGTTIENIISGMTKPFFFGLIIGSISCYKGLNTSGGTVGVGLATTRAVVLASVVVIVADFFLTRALQTMLGIQY